jgi:hypothetical protein
MGTFGARDAILCPNFEIESKESPISIILVNGDNNGIIVAEHRTDTKRTTTGR